MFVFYTDYSEYMIFETKDLELHLNTAIEPFKIMLIDRKGELSNDDWLNLVNRTKEGILTQPDQYIGKELPEADTLKMVVEKFFCDFLQQQN